MAKAVSAWTWNVGRSRAEADLKTRLTNGDQPMKDPVCEAKPTGIGGP